MSRQKFLMVDLEDQKAISLAKVISSQTSRKILDHLSQKEDSSESQIAKDLNLPLSTVHYNIQQMVAANILEAKHFQYSEKGKKVELYSLANKLIIIAPKQTDKSFMEKLSGILPAALVSLFATSLIYYFTLKPNLQESVALLADSGAEAVMMKTSLAMEAPAVMQTAQHVEPFWFLLGAVFVIGFMVVYKLLSPLQKSS